VTDDDALALAHNLELFANTHTALVALMKSIARYGRPSSLPDDVRGAWDDCERAVGESTVFELLAITSQAMQERGLRQIAKRARRRGR
jgi:hypothetical protein